MHDKWGFYPAKEDHGWGNTQEFQIFRRGLVNKES